MAVNCNYSAFYVAEPFSESGLGCYATHDFCYYSTLKAWKEKDSTFPFIDAHEKTYSVRDGINWENTLKPRLRERLRKSKNIILFLSSETKNSRALHEEISYGALDLGLPIIVVYPELGNSEIVVNHQLSSRVHSLWNRLPILKQAMDQVPTIHVPMKQDYLRSALTNSKFTIQDKAYADHDEYVYDI